MRESAKSKQKQNVKNSIWILAIRRTPSLPLPLARTNDQGMESDDDDIMEASDGKGPTVPLVKIEIDTENGERIYVPPNISKEKQPPVIPKRTLPTSRAMVREEIEQQILEVEINPGELDPFMNELRLIKGLITEITCADDGLGDRMKMEQDLDEDDDELDYEEGLQNYIQRESRRSASFFQDDNGDSGLDNDDFLDSAFDNVPEIDFPVDIADIKEEADEVTQPWPVIKPPPMSGPMLKIRLHKLESNLLNKYLNAKGENLKSRYLSMIERRDREAVSKNGKQSEKTRKTRKSATTKTLHLCQDCPFSSPSKKSMDRHVVRKHGDGGNDVPVEQICQLCNQEFPNVDAKSLHSCSVTVRVNDVLCNVEENERGQYECPICSELVDTTDELSEHYTKQHPPDLPKSIAPPRKKKSKVKTEVIDEFEASENPDGTYLW